MFGYHGLSPKIKPSLSAAIKKHYLNNNGVRDSNVHDIGRFFSDAHFNHPLHKYAALQSRIHPGTCITTAIRQALDSFKYLVQ